MSEALLEKTHNFDATKMDGNVSMASQKNNKKKPPGFVAVKTVGSVSRCS